MLSEPDDLEARGLVLLGASHAGAAIERSMLGAAHSMANPLTAQLGIVHGTAVGLVLPAVMNLMPRIAKPDRFTQNSLETQTWRNLCSMMMQRQIV